SAARSRAASTTTGHAVAGSALARADTTVGCALDGVYQKRRRWNGYVGSTARRPWAAPGERTGVTPLTYSTAASVRGDEAACPFARACLSAGERSASCWIVCASNAAGSSNATVAAGMRFVPGALRNTL